MKGNEKKFIELGWNNGGEVARIQFKQLLTKVFHAIDANNLKGAKPPLDIYLSVCPSRSACFQLRY